jgi:hypothetical protein
MAKFFCNMTYVTEVNDDQNASKSSNRRGGIRNRRHAREVIMGRIVKSTTGTRSGASHSRWKEGVRSEDNALRANRVGNAQKQRSRVKKEGNTMKLKRGPAGNFSNV